MSEPNEAQQLAAALGESTDPPLKIKNETVTVDPLTISQISRILLAIDRLAEKGVDVSGLVAQPGEKPEISYTQLILRGGDDFIAILAIASNREPAFVGSLNLLEISQLAGRVWTVNKDFFDQNQIEILKAFGLDETALDEIKKLYASIKSLVTSSPEESQTSEASPSPRSGESTAPSPENSAAK